jgi:hypothetical protein
MGERKRMFRWVVREVEAMVVIKAKAVLVALVWWEAYTLIPTVVHTRE